MKKPREILRELRTKGISVIDDLFSEEELKKFEEEYERIFREGKGIEVLDKEECSKDERIFHAQKFSSFINEKFANNPLFDQVCKKYTGRGFNKKTLINRLVYEDGKVKNSGAGWHRDNHDCQFKTIMYLTDVTERNGNFQWLTKSSKKHIGYPKSRGEKVEGNSRYPDETVDNLIKEKGCKLVNYTGKRGTIIFADTTYIHRGNIIEEGERKAITQYFF